VRPLTATINAGSGVIGNIDENVLFLLAPAGCRKKAARLF
jgi:hypothetical protein